MCLVGWLTGKSLTCNDLYGTFMILSAGAAPSGFRDPAQYLGAPRVALLLDLIGQPGH